DPLLACAGRQQEFPDRSDAVVRGHLWVGVAYCGGRGGLCAGDRSTRVTVPFPLAGLRLPAPPPPPSRAAVRKPAKQANRDIHRQCGIERDVELRWRRGRRTKQKNRIAATPRDGEIVKPRRIL